MSTERNPVTADNNNDISVTSFFGGAARGQSIQLTQRTLDGRASTDMFQHVQLTQGQAVQMVHELQEWLNEQGGK